MSTNPNPDRARRGATAQATLTSTGAIVPAPHQNEPTTRTTVLVQVQQQQGPVVEAERHLPPEQADEQPADEQAPQQPAVRETGLLQPQGPRKRTADPVRDHPAWKCVDIIGNLDAAQPQVKCKGCGSMFSGGATRVADHLFGAKGMRTCSESMADADFRAAKLKVQEKLASNDAKRKQKLAVALVNAAASTTLSPSTQQPHSVALSPQQSQTGAINFHPASAADVEGAIARFFYACNISAATIDHPQFKRMVQKLRTAPPSFKLPDRRKLYGPLLETTVMELQAETASLREAVLRDCGTFM